MPKRSNPFQHLIALIEKQLAPLGARVAESLMVRDRLTGDQREVDTAILVDGGAGRKLVIAIECRDHNRKQTVEFIDSLIGKYRDLEVDKVVAVSSSGFLAPAIEKSSKVGITTMTLEDAESVEWTTIVNKVETFGVEATMFKLLELHIGARGIKEGVHADPWEVILVLDGKPWGWLPNYLIQAEQQLGTLERLKQQNPRRNLGIASYSCHHGEQIQLPDGTRYPLDMLVAVYSWTDESKKVPLKHHKYGDAHLSLGKEAMFGENLQLIISEREGQEPVLDVDLPMLHREYNPKKK